jgi:hypothetical protein
MADVFNWLGLLPTRELVEAKATDLIGQFTGQSAPKMRQMLEDAKGKALLIDEVRPRTISSWQPHSRNVWTLLICAESLRGGRSARAQAYQLNTGGGGVAGQNSYGHDVINTLTQARDTLPAVGFVFPAAAVAARTAASAVTLSSAADAAASSAATRSATVFPSAAAGPASSFSAAASLSAAAFSSAAARPAAASQSPAPAAAEAAVATAASPASALADASAAAALSSAAGPVCGRRGRQRDPALWRARAAPEARTCRLPGDDRGERGRRKSV